MIIVDINCDVGEGINNEALLMPFISSCNIACGAHAGDQITIDHVIKTAQKNKVKIGAHPSFPDKKNFGRVRMDISQEKLEASLINQISLIKNRLELAGGTLNHIKAHGALYNLSITDNNIANVIVNAVLKVAPKSILYAPYNSTLAKVAIENNLNIKLEAFADRNYNDNLSLVSRTQKNALIVDKDEVIKHILQMILQKQVNTISGKYIPIQADTYCVHGDTTNAVELVKYIHQTLSEKGIKIA